VWHLKWLCIVADNSHVFLYYNLTEIEKVKGTDNYSIYTGFLVKGTDNYSELTYLHRIFGKEDVSNHENPTLKAPRFVQVVQISVP